MKFLLQLVAPLFLLLAPVASAAVGQGHGGNYTAKYVDGANIIILTNNVQETVSGVPIEHNLRLYDMTGQPVPFDAAAIEVKKASESLKKQTVPVSGTADIVFKYAYPKQGTYTILVSFLDHDKQVSRAEFPVVVSRGPSQSVFANAFTIETGLAFMLGLGTAWLYLERRRLRFPKFLKKFRA